jgi:hypothetical protein
LTEGVAIVLFRAVGVTNAQLMVDGPVSVIHGASETRPLKPFAIRTDQLVEERSAQQCCLPTSLPPAGCLRVTNLMKQAAVDRQPINGWSDERVRPTALCRHEVVSTADW